MAKKIEQDRARSYPCQRSPDRGRISLVTTEDLDPRADALWAAEIERRAREVADGKVALVDADEVHAEIAERLRSDRPMKGDHR